MSSDAVLLLVGLCGLSVLVGGLLLLVGFGKKKKKRTKDHDSGDEDEQGVAASAVPRRRARQRGMGKKKGRRNRVPAQEAEVPVASSSHQADDSAEDYEYDYENEEEALKHMTKKEYAKAMKKRQKAEQREARAAALEAREEKRREDEERRREEGEAREEEEARKEEERRKAAEAKAKAEKKEYDKWKTMFEVEEEGDNTGGADAAPFGALSDFLGAVERQKVVQLQALAVEFALDTSETAARLAALEEMGRVSGVFDDRGKFIHITLAEMEKVAAFIERQGRVSISALSAESNRLVDLEPAPAPAAPDSDNDATEATTDNNVVDVA